MNRNRKIRATCATAATPAPTPRQRRPLLVRRRPVLHRHLGLCKAATFDEIEAQARSLNLYRYVGVAKGENLSDEDFKEKFEALNEEPEVSAQR